MEKKDLEQIKNIVENVVDSKIKNLATKDEIKNLATKDDVKNEIESLAIMVAKGFEGVDRRFEVMEEDIKEINSEISYIAASLRQTKEKVGEMEENFVFHHEHEDLESRVKLCERKLKINSGR